ncbi:UDP-glycosyltransferase UGT33J1 [Danaus plexippus plexippus]|uniref:UDP-glucuronosyltransferase n=1 Tax=Danaus plexippus plexippus TaxID=278856 RepID=A0A212FLF4_DANPL|nr:UDP-glycosyltransferase UGT33J1 [Danaus plexippus plexippus]
MTFEDIREGCKFFVSLFQLQFETEAVQEVISKNEKFDLILIESIVRPALAYSYVFKAPVILVSSFTAVFSNNKIIGSPTHPLLYPICFRNRLYNLSFAEKIHQLYLHYMYEYADYLNEKEESNILRKIFGSEFPSLHELGNNVDMLLLNIHSLWADNQPVAPNVIYMGGIHQLPRKELPKDLKSYLDSSKSGVIYVSFGTNVLSNMIPEKQIVAIINVLSKLPYDVLWKWDGDSLPLTSTNIRTSKWFPQSDLLRHPAIKLFITQAGLQSTDEAITAEVPLIAFPMLADQWFNAEKYEKFNIGIKLHILSFTEKQLETAIDDVINNKSYRRNIIKLRHLMRDQPETPLNRTIWWIEHVLRHGGAKHLRSPAANMSYIDYFEVKLMLFILLLITVFILAFILVLKCFTKFIIRFFSNKNKIKYN